MIHILVPRTRLNAPDVPCTLSNCGFPGIPPLHFNAIPSLSPNVIFSHHQNTQDSKHKLACFQSISKTLKANRFSVKLLKERLHSWYNHDYSTLFYREEAEEAKESGRRGEGQRKGVEQKNSGRKRGSIRRVEGGEARERSGRRSGAEEEKWDEE